MFRIAVLAYTSPTPHHPAAYAPPSPGRQSSYQRTAAENSSRAAVRFRRVRVTGRGCRSRYGAWRSPRTPTLRYPPQARSLVARLPRPRQSQHPGQQGHQDSQLIPLRVRHGLFHSSGGHRQAQIRSPSSWFHFTLPLTAQQGSGHLEGLPSTTPSRIQPIQEPAHAFGVVFEDDGRLLLLSTGRFANVSGGQLCPPSNGNHDRVYKYFGGIGFPSSESSSTIIRRTS